MGSLPCSLIALSLALTATAALAQAGGEKGPERTVWAAHKLPDSPYTEPNRPIWHIADILKAHQGKPSWDQPVLLTRDFDGHAATGVRTHIQCEVSSVICSVVFVDPYWS